MSTAPDNESQLTDQARAGIRRVPWRNVAVGAAGASAVGLLGAAGLAPLLAAAGVGALAQGAVAQWLLGMGANVLAGWVGDTALAATRQSLADSTEAPDDAAQVAALAQQLDALLASQPAVGDELAALLRTVNAVDTALDALAEEVGAQSELLLSLHADLTGVAQQSTALQGYIGVTLRNESDRVIAAVEARADRSDAKLDQVVAELRRVRDEAVISIGDNVRFETLNIGDVAGRDLIKNFITQLPRATPPPYRMAVERMAEDYGAVFGGRDAELQRLDAWLAGDARPFAFLHAPTGRGKTALLIHWVAQVQQRGGWHVVFVPISLRYQTATAASALGALATGLADFHGELEQLNTTNTSPDQLRPIIADYLRRAPADDHRLLVVLDGLDEATGWTVGRELFPREPGAYVRLVASARWRAHMSLDDWLTQLGWEGQTCDLGLEGLNQAAVSDVLLKMGNPLDALATDVDLLSEIARVSQGDPLTIRYLVEALKDGSLSPGKLEALTPGLESFVRVWLEELEQHAANADAVYALLSLCAVALGPLTTADVQHLEPATFKRKAALNQAAKAVGRFVIGDGSEERGYVFGHPRLRELYVEEILSDAERDEARQRFVDDGRRWYAERQGEAPAYIRQFWVTHLAQANEWELAAQVVTGVEATEHGHRQVWAQLRYAAEGSYSGYLSDLDVIWQRAATVGYVALGVRCALIVATVRSLSGNISPELLYHLVTVGTPEGKWSIAAALEIARQMPYDRRKAEAIAKLAPIIPEHAMEVALEVTRDIDVEEQKAEALTSLVPHLPSALLGEAFATAASIENEESRAFALTELAPHLTLALLVEVIAVARAITNEKIRADTLIALAPLLPPDEQPSVLAEALKAARAITNQKIRADTLIALAPLLPPDEQPSVLAEARAAARAEAWARARSRADTPIARAPPLPPGEQLPVCAEALAKVLAEAWAITDVESRASTLTVLAPLLPPGERPSVLAEVLVAACAIPDEGIRARSLTALAPLLPLPLLAEALAAARVITDEWRRARSLTALAPLLPLPLLAEALAVARAITYAGSRADALTALAPLLPADDQPSVLVEALAAARAITYAGSRADALAALAPLLPADDQLSVLAEALAAARAITNENSRADTLTALAPLLPLPLLAKTLAAALAIMDSKSRADTLIVLVSLLPSNNQPSPLVEALVAARAITYAKSRADTLTALTNLLPPDDQPSVLAEALAAARAITDVGRRAHTLIALTPLLPSADQPAVLAEALAAARILTEGSRVHTLAALLPLLPPDEKPLVLVEALAAARAIIDAKSRADSLTALAPVMTSNHQPSVLVEALVAAREMRSNSDRSSTLTVLAPHLAEHNVPLPTWQETLRHLARNGRPALLNDLKALTPWLVALTTPEQCTEVAQAVIDVCKAWP